jgi:hypothetical protein
LLSHGSSVEVLDSVKLARNPPQEQQDIEASLAAVSFIKLDGFSQSLRSEADNVEYPPQRDIGNDFVGSQTAQTVSLGQVLPQSLPTIAEPMPFYVHAMFEKEEHCLVQAFLEELVEGFSNPSFQVKLQKLLMSSRERQNPGVGSGKKAVSGRCALSQTVEEKALAKIGFPKTATVSAYRLVSLFLHDAKVLAQMSLIDELLLLPSFSSLNAVQQCGQQHFEKSVSPGM